MCEGDDVSSRSFFRDGPTRGFLRVGLFPKSMTTPKTYRFELDASSLESFVGALLLGTLEAMRAGHWPLDAGIWTLGRPKFREPLERSNLPNSLLQVLHVADELSALEALAGRPAVDARLDQLIIDVRSQLESRACQFWDACVLD